MKIRKSSEKDFKGMIVVAKNLHPKWFDRFAINKSMPLDLRIHKGFVAEENGEILGFITYTSNDGETKISWIGVNPKFQRKGIGTKLLKRLEKELNKLGAKELRVETVAETENYKPYEITRTFYKKMGFEFGKVKKVKSKDTGQEFNLATYVKKL